MKQKIVGIPGRAWMGLAAGLGLGVVLGVVGLCLGFSFRAPAQEGTPAEQVRGPLVVITLQQGETVKGSLLESRNGSVRVQVAGEEAERVYPMSDVAGLDFAPKAPAVAQAEPKKEPTPPTTVEPEEKQPVDSPEPPKKSANPEPVAKEDPTPKARPDARPDERPIEWPKAHQADRPPLPPNNRHQRPIFEPFRRRRMTADDRRKRFWEFIKERADARLTPKEQERFHELAPREQKLQPNEKRELDELRKKMGLMDPELMRRMSHEVMEEAGQALRTGELSNYINAHLKRLSHAVTQEERRRHIFSIFAGAYVGKRDVKTTIHDTAINLMRSQKAPPGKLEDTFKDLRYMFDLFQSIVEKNVRTGPLPRGHQAPMKR